MKHDTHDHFAQNYERSPHPHPHPNPLPFTGEGANDTLRANN